MFTCIHTFCSNKEKIDFPPFHYQICYCHYFIINISFSIEVRKYALTSFYANTLLNCYALKINYDLSTDKNRYCIKSSIVYLNLYKTISLFSTLWIKSKISSSKHEFRVKLLSGSVDFVLNNYYVIRKNIKKKFQK